MRSVANKVVFGLLISKVLTACVQPITAVDNVAQSSALSQKQQLTAPCQAAVKQLEQAIDNNQKNDLKQLKNNIELHCVWRKY
ncbi:hypothetical protein [Paraglaciecola aestuariivivens]